VNRELETYLRRATRGLWGKKRLEVREELTQHILKKAHGHRVADFSQDAAIARALGELGDPRGIRSGMIGVHMIPNAMRLLLLSTVTAIIVITMTPRNAVADVQFDATGPAKLCKVCMGDASSNDLVWFNLKSLTNAFKTAGAKVSRQGAEYRVVIDGVPIKLRSSYKRGQDEFIVDWRLSLALSDSNLPWRISGWHDAELAIGSAKIRITSQTRVVPLISMYRNAVAEYVSREMKSLNHGWYASASEADTNRHVIETGKATGTIIALVTRRAGGIPIFDLGVVRSDGRVTLRGWYDKLRFVTAGNQLTPYASKGRWSAVLLALTGRVSFINPPESYAVFVPKQSESNAVK
jgi:hypothetical protein